MVNRTFGSVRFGSADFFRLLLNSSVRFAEQFGKILAEQFGSVRPSSKLGKFGSVRRKNSEFVSPLFSLLHLRNFIAVDSEIFYSYILK